jgi:hypothetical protein
VPWLDGPSHDHGSLCIGGAVLRRGSASLSPKVHGLGNCEPSNDLVASGTAAALLCKAAQVCADEHIL